MSATPKIPLREQVAAAERELAMRHRVYPGRVKGGHMSSGEMERGIAVMRAIRDTLRTIAEHEDVVREVISAAIRQRRRIAEAEEIRDSEPAAREITRRWPDAEVSVGDGAQDAVGGEQDAEVTQ